MDAGEQTKSTSLTSLDAEFQTVPTSTSIDVLLPPTTSPTSMNVLGEIGQATPIPILTESCNINVIVTDRKKSPDIEQNDLNIKINTF
jgi:hypothetical protein